MKKLQSEPKSSKKSARNPKYARLTRRHPLFPPRPMPSISHPFPFPRPPGLHMYRQSQKHRPKLARKSTVKTNKQTMKGWRRRRAGRVDVRRNMQNKQKLQSSKARCDLPSITSCEVSGVQVYESLCSRGIKWSKPRAPRSVSS